MNAAVIWTALAFIGVFGAIRNVVRRHQNVQAIESLGVNGPTVLTARAFRNSEALRLVQALIGLLIGVTALWFYHSDYYRNLEMIRAGGALPDPYVVVVYRNVLQYGLIAWQLCLVANIWYFGVIGDRAEALRRRLLDEPPRQSRRGDSPRQRRQGPRGDG